MCLVAQAWLLARIIDAADEPRLSAILDGLEDDPEVLGFCKDAGAPSHPTFLDAPALLHEATTRTAPDWTAVHAMKARASLSFDRALDLH